MEPVVKYPYYTLEDYLISNPLSVDGQLDDGWGAWFPVKGREIEAVILFVDMSSFSRITLDLSPTEILILVNNFFTWITAEGLRGQPGIVDKYIGDEIMVIFSKEFGSEDPFVDALQTARGMGERDYLAFLPHMGLASGLVTVGYVGTPLKYNCSVFGTPVALAKRCASIKSSGHSGTSIIFPATLWEGYSFTEVFPNRRIERPDGKIEDYGPTWELLPTRQVELKNMPAIEVIEVSKLLIHAPMQSATERAKYALRQLEQAGVYRPNKSKE